ncbi:hypothetical protein SAMD00019534_102030 [Acytostelium subglobosum LB1]|uniref:hypothetical protein n=1 Tax=Acytostelium subglobosum LB1 TaxID=1410327 RepID=UPI000644AC62|nr:hypothetical protein SAMD00019534_102030 [Acytostelium subglobosum LB1]GAM27028.1 hypothetical protein SAMD00019534_102030 [Acytostelium subglobosum LB1]|eukprot:XP_012749908.1 hypothetical protein SAMD00019534_102030 [Acytostelium subglobosum LB1]
MSDNNNNNNQPPNKFNSVFAYWDVKDKRVQQSNLLKRAPLINRVQTPVQKPPPTSPVTVTLAPASAPATPITVVPTAQVAQPEPHTNQPHHDQDQAVPESAPATDNTTTTTTTVPNDQVEPNTEVHTPDVVHVQTNQTQEEDTDENVVVGEETPTTTSNVNTSSGGGSSSQYDNFDPSRPVTQGANLDTTEFNSEVERELTISKTTSNYSSVYGSVADYSLYSGSDYKMEDDQDFVSDISEEALLRLEALISNEPQQLDNLKQSSTQLQTSNASYYISGASKTGYSHPKVLAGSGTTDISGLGSSKETMTWNSEFQNLLEMDDSLDKFERLASLEHDFVYAAEAYGRIIISEHLLPNEMKTIKPVSVGGVAGGDKYIVQGILFKFAVESDTFGLYGSDENAMKAAAHELNGCTSILNSGIKGLHVPLMAYIDYRGFRLMALSLLPINKLSLVYGSCDAGQTVHTSNTMFNHLMSTTSKVLNIKPHRVQDSAGDLKSICGPIDIEGHIGNDNRFYLLDFARLAPPEPPVNRGAYLYRLLRLELVRKNEVPLCSDSFSPMPTIDIETHNAEVRDAYDHMVTNIIPKFANDLEHTAEGALTCDQLSKLFHSEGINMRHLGLVRRCCSRDAIREVLLVEAISRCLKSLTRELLRREMKKTHLPSDYPYRKIILNFINLVFGSDNDEFLKEILLPKMEKKFRHINDTKDPNNANEFLTENQEESPLFTKDSPIYPRILHRFINTIGVVMSADSIKEYYKQESGMSFVDPDIVELKTQITRLNIIDYADGMSLYYKALESKSDDRSKRRLLDISQSMLKRSLHSMSTNYGAIFQLGNVQMLMAKYETDHHVKARMYDEAAETYLSMEKFRIDQNLLYLSKFNRGKAMLAKGKHCYLEKDVFNTSLEVFRDAAQNTLDKADAKALEVEAIFRCKGVTEQEIFDQLVNMLQEILHDYPNHPRTNLLMAKVLSYRKFHTRPISEVAHYFQLSSDNPNTLKKLKTLLKSDLWRIFPMVRECPKMFDDIKEQIKSMAAKLKVPEDLELIESDAHFFSSLDMPTTKLLLGNISPESFTKFVKFFNHSIITMSLIQCDLAQPPILTDLSKLRALQSINLAKCKGLTDEAMGVIMSPVLRKLKIYEVDGITDATFNVIATSAPALEVLDAGQCPNISDVHAESLVAGCPNLRKLAMPTKVTGESIRTCLSGLTKLVALDLYQCEDIPSAIYGEAFKLSESVKKVRGSDGFPHFILKNTTFIATFRGPNAQEAMMNMPSESRYFVRIVKSMGMSMFQGQVFSFYFDPKHPVVKFRDLVIDGSTTNNSWHKIGHFSVVKKPQFRITMAKRTPFNTWETDFHLQIPPTGLLTKTECDVQYNGIKYRLSHRLTPVFSGMAFETQLYLDGKVVASASNLRSNRINTIVDLKELPSIFLPVLLSCGLSEQV